MNIRAFLQGFSEKIAEEVQIKKTQPIEKHRRVLSETLKGPQKQKELLLKALSV